MVDATAVGSHLVMKVKYPSCKRCDFDSQKVMVFLNVDFVAALKWRRIDPHFSDKPRAEWMAPSPAARFPATDEGWRDALVYATKADEVPGIR